MGHQPVVVIKGESVSLCVKISVWRRGISVQSSCWVKRPSSGWLTLTCWLLAWEVSDRQPPNNWPSIFGGPAWTRVTESDGKPGQWYLHIFAKEQPDLNWENPDVFADLEKTLRFWLERGIDGFRIDVAHGMAKPDDLPDHDWNTNELLRNSDDDPRFNNPAVHAIHRWIRTVMDEYPNAVTVGEIWVRDNVRFGEYIRPDELHLGFNFRLAEAEFSADAIRAAIDEALDAKAKEEERVIVFNLSGHGFLDLGSYDAYLGGRLEDYAYPEELIRTSLQKLPQVTL
mgnify:CR=1 FL=1